MFTHVYVKSTKPHLLFINVTLFTGLNISRLAIDQTKAIILQVDTNCLLVTEERKRQYHW